MKLPNKIRVSGVLYKQALFNAPRKNGVRDALGALSKIMFERGWLVTEKPASDVTYGSRYYRMKATSPAGHSVLILAAFVGKTRVKFKYLEQEQEVLSVTPDVVMDALEKFVGV